MEPWNKSFQNLILTTLVNKFAAPLEPGSGVQTGCVAQLVFSLMEIDGCFAGDKAAGAQS